MDDRLKTGDNRGEPRKPLKHHCTIFLSPSLKTIEQLEKTLPVPLPFCRGQIGGNPFHPRPIHWCHTPGMSPESRQILPPSPSPKNGVRGGYPLFTPVHNSYVCPRPLPRFPNNFSSGVPDSHWFKICCLICWVDASMILSLLSSVKIVDLEDWSSCHMGLVFVCLLETKPRRRPKHRTNIFIVVITNIIPCLHYIFVKIRHSKGCAIQVCSTLC